MELIPLGTLTAHTGKSWRITDGPLGTRSVSELPRVVWDGDRVRARSHWANGTYRSTPHTGEVQVRTMLEADDGALIYLDYVGRFLPRGLAGGSGHVMMTGRIETADERYRWLNTTQVVGKGTLSEDRMTYEVFALE